MTGMRHNLQPTPPLHSATQSAHGRDLGVFPIASKGFGILASAKLQATFAAAVRPPQR